MKTNKPQAPKSPVPEPVVAPKGKGRKLSFKEQRELEGMEAAIHAAEADVARLETMLASPDFFRTQGARASAVITELDTAKAQAARLFARWEELEALRSAAA